MKKNKDNNGKVNVQFKTVAQVRSCFKSWCYRNGFTEADALNVCMELVPRGEKVSAQRISNHTTAYSKVKKIPGRKPQLQLING